MDEVKVHVGLFIGRHISLVLVATRHVAAHYGETGKMPSALAFAMLVQCQFISFNCFHRPGLRFHTSQKTP